MTTYNVYNQLSPHIQERIADLVWLVSVDSTQDYLYRQLASRPNHDNRPYYICLADYQTNGRGQRKQGWQALPEDSLLVSVAWSVDDIAKWQAISLAAAVEVHKMLSQYCSDLQLKWPNDIYYGSAKLGGLLVDSYTLSNHYSQIIMGVGINIKQAPVVPDQTVTALQTLSNYPLDRVALAVELITGWLEMLDCYEDLSFQSWHPYWHSVDALIQQRVQVDQDKLSYQGLVQGVDNKGQLVLQNDQGEQYCVNSGRVRFNAR